MIPTKIKKATKAVIKIWLVTVKPKGNKPSKLENKTNKKTQKNKGKYRKALNWAVWRTNKFKTNLYNNSTNNCQEFEITYENQKLNEKSTRGTIVIKIM